MMNGMAGSQGTDENQWHGIEEMIEDPEEVKVIFCALDSFLSVTCGYPFCLGILSSHRSVICCFRWLYVLRAGFALWNPAPKQVLQKVRFFRGRSLATVRSLECHYPVLLGVAPSQESLKRHLFIG